jgi:hypothetical protein
MEQGFFSEEIFSNSGNQKPLKDKGGFDLLNEDKKNLILSVMEIELQMKSLVEEINAMGVSVKANYVIEKTPSRRARVLWRNNVVNFNEKSLFQALDALTADRRLWYKKKVIEARNLELNHRLYWRWIDSISEYIDLQKKTQENFMI